MRATDQPFNRLLRLQRVKEKHSLDCFLFSSPETITYLSGYSFYFEYGPSPFQFIPALLAVLPDLSAGLILADNETAPQIPEHCPVDVLPYESYVYEKAPDPVQSCLHQLAQYLKNLSFTPRRIGFEGSTLPLVLASFMETRFPGVAWVDITKDLETLRSVKDEEEIGLIREAAALADQGQRSVMQHARPGMTELELFALVRRDIDSLAGARVPLMADLSTGKGSATGGGMPGHSIIREGDLILSDFTPCLHGYWGDSCNTRAVGSATEEQKKTFQRVREALEIGIQAIKPGVRACEIDSLMRAHTGSFPHHGGHGVGTQYHEAPRIVPYNQTKLLPGMVIALEPAIYKEGFGIRLEHLVLVTETGNELLTRFGHTLQ